MFAINHAAAALPIKRKFPDVPLWALLLSVQAAEMLWVVFNLVGIEKTTTARTVSYVGDVHLVHMPWSHSVAGVVVVAAVAWTVLRLAGKRRVAAAVALGVVSHLVLDVVTHAADIAFAPGIDTPKIGFGLYSAHPLLAFAVELGFGIACWAIYRGSAKLLAAIVLFNLANVTMFLPAVPGPEALMAGRPLLVVALVGVQIAVTLVAVGWLARPQPGTSRQQAVKRSDGGTTRRLRHVVPHSR